MQNQLPVANIHDVMQDSEGFIWYGTEGGGLCRDDGYRIDVYRSDRDHPNLLASNNVTALSEDSHGHIWFGTTKGCYWLDKANYSIHLVPETEGKSISTLCCRANGDMYVGLLGELMLFDSSQDLKKTFRLGNGDASVFPTCMVEDSKHHLYLTVANDGLCAMDDSLQELIQLEWPYQVEPCYIVPDSVNGGFWIGTRGLGVVRYRQDFRRVFNTASEDETGFMGQVLNLVPDNRRNILWVTTMDDLYAYRIEGDSLASVNLTSALPGRKRIIDHAMLDRAGQLWVPGVTPHSFIITTAEGDIRRDAVSAMIEKVGDCVQVERIRQDDDGYYWIWQPNKLLTLYYAPFQQLSFANESAVPEAQAFDKCIEYCRKQSGVWTTKESRVFHVWHIGMKIHHRELVDVGQTVTAVFDDFHRLLVGTSDGLYEYSLPGDNIDGQKSQLKTLAQGVGEVRKIGVSSDGIVLFVSSKQGLCYIDATGKVRSVKSDVDFTSLSLSKTDVVWAGTSEGQVYTAKLKQLINSGDIQLSKEASLTKGTVIRELVVGLRGHVWILSDLYLKEYNPITHISRLMNHSASNINMKKLCTINMESDSISLGGIGAFCLIPASEQLNEPGVALRPRISSAFIDDIECFVQEGDHLYIPRTAKEVRLFVTTFNYLHAASIQLAYRLDEDDDWTELSVGENCIVLTDLPDGDNDLQLRATDKYGNWGEPMHCVYLHKTAPWYAAWWLMVLILGALLILGYCVWKKRQWLIGLVKPSAKPTKPEEQPAKLEEETAKPEEEPAKPEEEPAKTEEEPATTPTPVISSPSDEPTEETTQPADTPPVTKPKRKRKAKAAPAPEPETKPISESKSESESESQPTSELKPESNLDSKSEEQHKELSFEEKLERALQRNIGDVDFGVEELSAALFMSRMNLYRKMQATLGVKPADYLRNKRLDLAERLLRETDEAITAISEQTGFKNRRSFSMAFKEKYGISPTEFRENLRKTNSKD